MSTYYNLKQPLDLLEWEAHIRYEFGFFTALLKLNSEMYIESYTYFLSTNCTSQHIQDCHSDILRLFRVAMLLEYNLTKIRC